MAMQVPGRTSEQVNTKSVRSRLGGAFGAALAGVSAVVLAASTDAEALLRQARATFKPLPKDIGPAKYPLVPC
jgi:hypothetical protein